MPMFRWGNLNIYKLLLWSFSLFCFLFGSIQTFFCLYYDFFICRLSFHENFLYFLLYCDFFWSSILCITFLIARWSSVIDLFVHSACFIYLCVHPLLKCSLYSVSSFVLSSVPQLKWLVTWNLKSFSAFL